MVRNFTNVKMLCKIKNQLSLRPRKHEKILKKRKIVQFFGPNVTSMAKNLLSIKICGGFLPFQPQIWILRKILYKTTWFPTLNIRVVKCIFFIFYLAKNKKITIFWSFASFERLECRISPKSHHIWISEEILIQKHAC